VSAAFCIAVLGAESTGKTTLAQGLSEALAAQTALRTAWVPEALRQWCDNTGRTPLAHEQGSILRMQHQAIDEAASTHAVVVCDTTGLMTALYSQVIFGDTSLLARAVALHQRMACTLVLTPDLPWVADGHQRDGPVMQQRVQLALLALLRAERLPFFEVAGSGGSRLAHALAAVLPLLHQEQGQQQGQQQTSQSSGKGLFSRLHGGAKQSWLCGCCTSPSRNPSGAPSGAQPN
jgi:nicotinamide riboside kinase